jgi:hypothetical protein
MTSSDSLPALFAGLAAPALSSHPFVFAALLGLYVIAPELRKGFEAMHQTKQVRYLVMGAVAYSGKLSGSPRQCPQFGS